MNGWVCINYIYFVIFLFQFIKDYGYMDKGKVLYKGFWWWFNIDCNFLEMIGWKLVVYFNFDIWQNLELVIKVVFLVVSIEGVVKNLQVEVVGKIFN